MSKFDIPHAELVWPGKYAENGQLLPSRRLSLPFQVIERVDETPAARQQRAAGRKGHAATFFDDWALDSSQAGGRDDCWRNQLIWGDNLYVMGSLLDRFAGKIDLIYIDPPFASGADFPFQAQIGSRETTGEQAIVEGKAYRDRWGEGLKSYLQMMYARLDLMQRLLSDKGAIIVHLASDFAPHIKLVMDEVFGRENYRNQILVKRGRKNLQAQFETIDSLMKEFDTLLLYTRSPQTRFAKLEKKREEIRPGTWNNHWRGTERPTMRYELFGITPSRGQWRWSQERSRKAVQNYEVYKTDWADNISVDEYWRKVRDESGEELDFVRLSATGNPEHYVPPSENILLGDIWLDIGAYARSFGYPTEKSEALLERIIGWLSQPGDLVADFFCGSGTTLSVAEKMGRRWIGGDMGRFAIHTSRKRLLELAACRPFEILELGREERKVWQEVTFAGPKPMQQTLDFECIRFILKLYGAQPLSEMQRLHGKRGNAAVHVGAVDAPVTIAEIHACLAECRRKEQKELHILGWEWERGLTNLIVEEVRQQGMRLLLLTIPREVMEQQAVDRGDIHFYELAHLGVKIHGTTEDSEKKLESSVTGKISVELTDFTIPHADLIPPEVRQKIEKWSDYLDCWAVDWDFRNDIFLDGWTSYRTPRERVLQLKSEAHQYPTPGIYRIMVRVIDVFGNEVSQALEVKVA